MVTPCAPCQVEGQPAQMTHGSEEMEKVEMEKGLAGQHSNAMATVEVELAGGVDVRLCQASEGHPTEVEAHLRAAPAYPASFACEMACVLHSPCLCAFHT